MDFVGASKQFLNKSLSDALSASAIISNDENDGLR
jgi:hypothetical protein